MNIKRIVQLGLAVVLLLTVACTANDKSEKNNENDREEQTQKQQEDIQPVYAEIDDAPLVLQDPMPLEDFSSDTDPSNTDVVYDLDLQMEDDGTFQLITHVTVQNQSDDAWDHLVFYLIPNAFTEENKPEQVKGATKLDMKAVQVNEEDVPYSLEGDTLALELDSSLEKGESAEATINYTFTVPEEGLRFSEYDGDYFLAQFYPMLATYQDGWNKEDYNLIGESYHTDFSDFSVTYEIPEGYSVFSSSDQEFSEETDSGKLEMENIKEFYMAVMKTDNLDIQSEDVNGTEIRVISDQYNKKTNSFMKTAKDSFKFFEENIGPYPHDQLDVIATSSDDGGGMEYPGIVTVDHSLMGVSVTIAHEIAHQWFYGVVSNDAFHDPWVDEGITEFVTQLYRLETEGYFQYDNFLKGFRYEFEEDDADSIMPVNLALDDYEDDGKGLLYFRNVYSRTTYQLLNLFDDYGGKEGALQFLSDYFETYQYKEVDSEELVNYLISYLEIDDFSVFDEWLEVDTNHDDR